LQRTASRPEPRHPGNGARAEAHPRGHGEGAYLAGGGGAARGHHRRRLLGLSYSIRFDSQPRERDRIYAFSQTHLDPAATGEPPLRIFVDPKASST